MSYTGATPKYKIPYLNDGDTVDGETEELISLIIENQLQLGALSGPFVAKEGSYSITINADTTVTIALGGSPAVRGCLNGAFLNYNGILSWKADQAGVNYLYLSAADDIFANPASVTPIVSTTKIINEAYLLMAYVDRTIPATPILQTSPPDKPTLLNLSLLLNTPLNPFGLSLRQDNLTIGGYLKVYLTATNSLLVDVLSTSSAPGILIDNKGAGPSIQAAADLSFGDSRLGKVNFTDAVYNYLPDNASSILGAIIKASKNPIAAISVVGGTYDDGTTIFTNARSGNSFSFTLSGNRTLANPTNGLNGQRIVWKLKQDATGNRLITLDSKFRLGTTISSVVLTTTASKTDYLEAMYDSTDDRWDVIRFVKGY